MKAHFLIPAIIALLAGAFLLPACSDALWHAAQLPGLRGVSDRMNDRALQQRLASDPVRELAQNTAQGDYRFRGLMDPGQHRNWVPGVPEGRYPASHVEYLVTDQKQDWTPSAERYFTAYNRALVPRREGKRLDSYGVLAQ